MNDSSPNSEVKSEALGPFKKHLIPLNKKGKLMVLFAIILIIIIALIVLIFGNKSLTFTDNLNGTPVVNLSGTPIPRTVIPTMAAGAFKTFTSFKYNLSFDYPASLGDTSTRTDNDYYNDEYVTFQDSPIEIQYWRFEGDFWSGAIAWENINSKDGKSCSISTIISGTNNAEFILAALCDGAYSVEDKISLTSSVFIVDQGLKTQSEVNSAKLIFEQIISTLQFDFSNLIVNDTGAVIVSVAPTAQGSFSTFTSKKYSVSFEYPDSFGTASISTDDFGFEVVSFSNSNIYVQYPGIEDPPIGDFTAENVTTKDGKNCAIETFQDNSGQNFPFINCNSLSNGTVYINFSGTPSDINAYELLVKQIASTLAYSF